MRLIDANKIPWKSYPNDYGETNDDYVEKCDIDKMQTVDAVPVVRCKDCKHRRNEEIGRMVYCPNQISGWVGENWFCADGERKDDENA